MHSLILLGHRKVMLLNHMEGHLIIILLRKILISSMIKYSIRILQSTQFKKIKKPKQNMKKKIKKEYKMD
jgi:hypothetical protein